jgi:hypothetical protein
MLNLTSTFTTALNNIYQNMPQDANVNSTISARFLVQTPLTGKTKFGNAADIPHLLNTFFSADLYEYRRASNITFSLGSTDTSKFAEDNLTDGNIYKKVGRKRLNKKLIDLCKIYMKSDLEKRLKREVTLHEKSKTDEDTKTYQHKYEILETIKSFNEQLIIFFLNIANIFTYPNETFYSIPMEERIITPDTALEMANELCGIFQEEFENVLVEIYPIRETFNDIIKADKIIEKEFEADIDVELKKKKTNKKK